MNTAAAEDTRTDERFLAELGIQVSSDSIAGYLQTLATTDSHDKYATLIGKLSDPSFTKREEVQRLLLCIPAKPDEILQKAADGAEPEARQRATAILKALKIRSSEDRRNELLLVIARVVKLQKLKGLSELLIATLPCLENGYLQSQVTEAARASVEPQDREDIEKYLKSDHQAVRIAGASVLGVLAGSERELATLLNDPNHHVSLEAAFALANRGDRRGVVKLADLLTSQYGQVRQNSVQMLRALTEKKFGYSSEGNASDVLNAAARWRTCSADDTVKLKFPVDRPRRSSEGLILHYTFDDNEGDQVRDRSGFGYHAKLVGPKLIQDEKRGQICAMSGGQHIALPANALSDLRAGTVAAWLRIDRAEDQQILNCVFRSGKEDINVQFRTGKTNCLFAYLGSQELSGRLVTEQPIRHREWIFAAFTWATNRGAIYLNGEQITVIEDANNALFIPKTTRSFWIGRDTRKSYPQQDLRGALSQLMVFNRELSPMEIKDLHQKHE